MNVVKIHDLSDNDFLELLQNLSQGKIADKYNCPESQVHKRVRTLKDKGIKIPRTGMTVKTCVMCNIEFTGSKQSKYCPTCKEIKKKQTEALKIKSDKSIQCGDNED